jgi:hypothetical protein|tara:strand:+ start:890 stop:1207 length:318 start_codon:yes stop_codon:yes gene_type:complete
MYNRIDEYFIKYYNTSPVDNKINCYLYCNTVFVNYLYIGAIIGKKGVNIKALITNVKYLTFENFEYYIDKTITDKKNICIYILANNKQTLTIATKQLHSNIHKYL